MIDLQIAVAKAMGWRVHHAKDGVEYWIDPKTPTLFGVTLPPITLDLMWQSEEMLKTWEQRTYGEYLTQESPNGVRNQIWALIHSTAEQRARAWLKIKGVTQ